MRYSTRLSVGQAVALGVLVVLCWTADLWGVPLYARTMPHEYCCLIGTYQGEPIHVRGFWTDLLRWGVFLAPILLLCGLGRGWSTEFGLTLGQFRVTLLWTVLTTGVSVALVVLALLVPVPLDPRLGFSAVDLVLGWQPSLLYTALGEKLWRASVMAPLIEEFGYRAMMMPTLVRLGGRYAALLASGIVWAGLHWLYQAPTALLPFYFVSGIFVTWVFLSTRSIVPGLVIHSAFNGVFEIGMHAQFVGLGNAAL